MTKQRITRVSCMSFLFLALLAVSSMYVTHRTATAKAAPMSGCGTWGIVNTPNPGSGHNYLNSVAAISANDVWAVGSEDNNGPTQTLTEHWNGFIWSVIPVSMPDAGMSGSFFYGVSAVSTNDVWAVGSYYNNNVNNYQTLTEHWNGTNWSIVASPNPGSPDSLNGVAAISTRDVWAVGNYTSAGSGASHTLTEHWNGSKWSVVNSPNLVNSETKGGGLNGLTAISAGNIWAVGRFFNARTHVFQTLIEHWNGSKWSVVASPNIQATDNYLTGVTAISIRDLWAVGYTFGSTSQTLIEHWNGSKWRIVSSPGPGASANFFEGVTAISSNDVWAIGEYLTSKSSSFQTLTEQWNGSTWSVVASPNPPGSTYDILQGITRVPNTGQIWAVGNYTTSGNITETLAAFYC